MIPKFVLIEVLDDESLGDKFWAAIPVHRVCTIAANTPDDHTSIAFETAGDELVEYVTPTPIGHIVKLFNEAYS